MNRTSLPAPEQKEHARHGEQLFPLQKYITTLDDLHPSVSAHWHEEAEFTRILSGSGTYQIQLQHYDVAAGDLLFIPPALLHAITVTPREKLCTETYVFHMHFLGASTADICSVQYLTPLATAKLIPPFFFDARHPLHDALDDLFNDMDTLHDDAAQGYELLLKADFLRLIALLLPCCNAADEDTRLHMEYTAKLKTVLEYIDAPLCGGAFHRRSGFPVLFQRVSFHAVFQALHGYLLLKLHQKPASGEGCRAARAGRASPTGRLPVRRLPQPVLLLPGIPEKIRRDSGEFSRSRCPGEVGFIIGNIIPARSSGAESLKQNARVSSLPLSAIHSVSLPRLNNPRMCPTNPQTMSGLPSSTKHTSSQT